MSTEKIMEQAQVFASAWSVVGGPFDGGDAMEVATQEKDELRRMVAELVEERDALAARLAELEGQEPTAWMNAKRDMASFIHFYEDDLPLFARPVPVEPVNVDFGMRGENMFFQIGNQSFLLDYKPEEQGEFEFMKAMLLSAFSRITHGVKTEIQPVDARLLNVSTGKLGHINAGLCPDSINGPDSRDPACPACRAIAEADADLKLENILRKSGEADFPPGYCLDPNGKMSVPFGREEDFNFGYEIGFREAWEITNSAIRAAGRIPDKQQALILEGMHGAGRETEWVKEQIRRQAESDVLNDLLGSLKEVCETFSSTNRLWKDTAVHAMAQRSIARAEAALASSDDTQPGAEERRLRRMLCRQRHGVSAYMDDGEATFGGDEFQRPTDYLRESLDSIEQAWIEAGRKQVAQAEPQAQRPTDYSSMVDRAWARFCGAFGDGPDAPYPGMIAAFETHYGQSFRDKEWRTEAACWAAAWHKATEQAAKTQPQPSGD